MEQAELFEKRSDYPAGFRHVPEFISRAEERRLLDHFQGLEFKPFEFHGFLGKRRIVSFGWRYDFNGGGLQKTNDIPQFLDAVRSQAAALVKSKAYDLQQVLLTEYHPGATIGWHKDRSVFGDVVGVSLLSACTFRLRKKADSGWHLDRAGAEVGLSSPRRSAPGMGAQHPGGRPSSILHHVSQLRA
jgi:alkylated DNA repair dioxygenase AlkB